MDFFFKDIICETKPVFILVTYYKLGKEVRLPVIPSSEVSTCTSAPIFDYGWGIIRPALILLIFTILRRESVGKQLLILGKVFRRLSHTTTHGKQNKRRGPRERISFFNQVKHSSIAHLLKDPCLYFKRSKMCVCVCV